MGNGGGDGPGGTGAIGGEFGLGAGGSDVGGSDVGEYGGGDPDRGGGPAHIPVSQPVTTYAPIFQALPQAFKISSDLAKNDIALGSGWGSAITPPIMPPMGYPGAPGNVYTAPNASPMAGFTNNSPFSFGQYMGGLK